MQHVGTMAPPEESLPNACEGGFSHRTFFVFATTEQKSDATTEQKTSSGAHSCPHFMPSASNARCANGDTYLVVEPGSPAS